MELHFNSYRNKFLIFSNNNPNKDIMNKIKKKIEKSNYTLIVSVRKHPTIILREEYQDPKSFRFVVDLNQSESPV